jgi:hypothetical protein
MKGVWDCAATSRVAVIRAIATLRWRRGTIAVVRFNDEMMRAEATLLGSAGSGMCDAFE